MDGNHGIVSVRNLSVYYGAIPALEHINLEVQEGEYLGIIGPNGGGKSTLLKTIIGIVPRAEGSVTLFGEKPEKGRRLTGYVPQISAVDKQFPITVSEVVLTGCLKPKLRLFARYSKQEKEFADSLIEKVGLTKLANRQVSQLSGGEFQKMLIARALAVRPKLLLLDEPTASVDAASREQIYALLAELNKEMTIIIVTHDLLAVSAQVTRLACLNRTLIYHGEPELNEHVVNSLYGCPVDLIAHGVPHRVLKEHDEKEGGGLC
ncbi:MAG TPA: ABC transporter ATP-binding protein [Bacillota bacterium]|nr:ABC transporter ATP-binding protein [Bacillota bacterium]HOK69150.1 ABC transporter ATP-binding protein [Bacillota bacterium]HPP84927.1 ABC transporter ATP-binding protein [Bacillota bacterium]